MSSAHDQIDAEVKGNDVVLFMKGTPQFPQCGFSSQVVKINEYLVSKYKSVNVLENAEIRQGIHLPGLDSDQLSCEPLRRHVDLRRDPG